MEKYATHEDLKKLKEEILKASTPVKEKKKRSLSKYNIFMKKEMKSVKSKNPDIAQKDLFKICVDNWNSCKDSK